MTDLYAPVPKQRIETTNLTLRIQKELKDAFVKHCEDRGVSASLVIKRLIENELAAASIPK